MFCNFKRKIILVGPVALFVIFLFFRGTHSDVWAVLTGGLSKEISVRKAAVNSVYYVLKQTHEPLFRKDDGQNYTSRLLKSWNRNLGYSSYTFCPDTSLTFNAGNVFSLKYFAAYLKGVSEKYDPDFSISSSSLCITIGFAKKRENYLDFLSLYENAPTVVRKDGFEDGLGPFTIDSIKDKKFILSRKQRVPWGYNRIVYYEYQGEKDSQLQNRDISDFNRISSFDIPEWAKQNYQKFDNIQLNAVDLMINHPNPKVRDIIYNCMDVEEFRHAFVPKRKDFYNIQTVFPLGIPGAIPGKPLQACKQAGRRLSGVGPLVFANWRYDNEKELTAFFDTFYKRTGLRIILKNYSAEKLMQVIFNKPKPYNLIVIVFDAVRPQESIFLEAFFRKEGYLDVPLSNIKPLYQKMLYEHNPEIRIKLACEIAEVLKNKQVVLPLYQNMGALYYPKQIKNLEVGKGFLEYPEVADFRW